MTSKHSANDIVVLNYDVVSYTMCRVHILVSAYDVVVATTSGISIS